jgi:hypothetical protein
MAACRTLAWGSANEYLLPFRGERLVAVAGGVKDRFNDAFDVAVCGFSSLLGGWGANAVISSAEKRWESRCG